MRWNVVSHDIWYDIAPTIWARWQSCTADTAGDVIGRAAGGLTNAPTPDGYGVNLSRDYGRQ
jgi:hypothetical protein